MHQASRDLLASRKTAIVRLKFGVHPSRRRIDLAEPDEARALEPILTDWQLSAGGLYFVTPTARARPAKVSALADFLIAELTDAPWRAETTTGPKSRRRRAVR